MGRPFLTYLLSATLLAACGPTEVTVDGGPISDASSGPAGRIEVESETALTLMYGESSEILVKYFEGRAAGVGVELSFALAGNASDADLMDLNRVTDAAGRAQTTLVAGTVGSAFRLRISAERASPAFVNVSVSDSGFGGITVRADYMGARAESTRRVVTVYSGVECAPADGYPPSAVARQVTLEDDAETEVVFNTLPSGLQYTVVGVVEGSTGTPLATACTDGVEVVADELTPARLSFNDAALSPAGTYEIELGLDADAFGDIATRGVDAGLTTATQDADSFLDALDQSLRDRGLEANADSLAAERSSGEPATSLAVLLASASADSEEGLRQFFARLLELFASVRIGGPLEFAFDGTDVNGSWDALSLEVGAPLAPDGPPPLTLDPSMTGLDFAPVLGLAWRADSDEMEVGSLSLAVPLGALLSAAMEVAANDVASSPGAALREASGCSALTAWVASRPALSSVCDSTCADQACLGALNGALDAAQTAIMSEPGLDAITLRGWLVMFDDDGDLVADRLGGTLSGTWAGTGTTTTVETIGEIAGTRVRAAD